MKLEPIISHEQIAIKVSELAVDICNEFKDQDNVCVLGVLNGSFIFVSDLIRKLPDWWTVKFVRAYSYQGIVRKPIVVVEPTLNLTGQDVLIVDDIYDSGLTMSEVTQLAWKSGANKVEACTLLRKDSPRGIGILSADGPKFVGFDIPNTFVVGYGLDFDGRYRGLPGVYNFASR